MGIDKKSRKMRAWPWIIIALVCIIALAVVATRTNAPAKTSAKGSPSPSMSSSTSHGTGNSSFTASSASPSPSAVAASPTLVPTTVGSPPPPPSGTVLNIHSTTDTSAQTLQSACQTSAQYQCTVQATNTVTGKVVTLQSVKVDGSGDAIINWSGASVGVGAWKVRLLAINGTLSTPSVIYDQLEVTQ